MLNGSTRATLWVCLAFVLSASLAGSAFSAIGVYPRSKPGLVPAPISYVLNKDADSLAGESPDWSLKIEIVPVAGGTAVKTWRFLPGSPEAAKGVHNNAVVWDGLRDNGTPAPIGKYNARITARANPVTNDTNIHLLWIDTPSNLYYPAVNNNTNSEYYGRIYVTQKTNGVRVYEPDGTYIGTSNCGLSWGTGSGPWGCAVDANSNVWVNARGGTQAMKMYAFSPDLSQKLCGPVAYGNNDRGCDVYGPTDDAKLLVSVGYTSAGDASSYCQLYSAAGNCPATMNMWRSPASGGGGAEAMWILPAKIVNDASAGKVRALVPFRHDGAGGTGGIFYCDVDWAGTGGVTQVWRNDALSLALGCDVSPDGSTLWVTRNTVTDGQEVGKVSLANAPSATAFDQLYGLAGTGAPTQLDYMRIDGYGNLVSTGGGFTEAFEPNIGFYEPPEASPVSVAVATVPTPNMQGIQWDGDDSPMFVSGSFSDTQPCAGQPTTLTVTVSDNGNNCSTGASDIGSVRVTCAALGWNDHSMNYVSCNGKQRTYSLTGIVQPGAAAGDTSASVVVYDATPGVTAGTGNVPITIVGAFITGVITNGDTGGPAPNVTVSATLGAAVFTGVTDATGRYNINVDAGNGYTVTPVTAGPYGATTPAEYNLQPNWPTAGTGEWPKSVDAVACASTADVSGSVYPLATTQVFYDWISATHVYLPGNREVSVVGTVMRQPNIADVPQSGFNGYYWIVDTRYQGTPIACKVAWRAGDPVVKKGDKVVVTGMYDVPYGYRTGRVTPSSAASVVVISHGNAIPPARDLSYYRNGGATSCTGSQIIPGNIIGGLYTIPGTTVTAVDAANIRYTVQIPDCAATPTMMNVTVDLNTDVSTGCPMPAVGDELMITGVLDEISVWDIRAIRPGEPGDQTTIPLAHSLGEAVALADGAVKVDFASGGPGIVTYADPNLGGQQWFYVESADRSAGIRVNCTGFSPQPYAVRGDLVSWLKGRLQITSGDRELALSQLATVTNTSNEGNVPDPVGITNLSTGAGYPSATDRAAGARTQGLYATLWGRVTRTEVLDFVVSVVWIDDGSACQSAWIAPDSPSVVSPAVGVKCYIGSPYEQPYELSVGDYVVVSGIAGSEWINDPAGGYRIRVLRMRGPHPVTSASGDVFRIIEDVP